MKKYIFGIIFSLILMVGSFIGLGLTIGWWPTIFMYCFVWGNNLERKITNEKPKG